MKKLVVSLLSALFAMTSFGKGEKHHHHHGHKQHGAHIHGHANISIAFDGSAGVVEFKAPAEGVVGFEHKATSKKDIEKQQTVFTQVEREISQLVQFNGELSCQFSKEKMEVTHEGEHGDFLAQFKVSCAKSPEGTELVVENKTFPKIKEIDVTILIGSVQKTVELSKKPIKVILK